jgi:hypothetical protein
VIDLIETMAAAMWKEDAMRAAPNVGRNRTPDEFAVQAAPVRDRWRGFARAAIKALAEVLDEVEPERRFISDPPRPDDPVPEVTYFGQPEGAVPDDYGFCRKCGAPMAEGIAMGQTYTPGSPDFPGDKEAVTFSAGGPGEVIRALKCTACGWSVT